MPLPVAYHRPDTVEQALSLLSHPNRIPLGGGTVLNADREPSELEVVDLQALSLAGIETDGVRLRIGAATTLEAAATSDRVPAWLRSIARAEAPSTLRTLATIGGVIAGGCGNSVLLAALLVSDAEVELAGAPDQPLEALLAHGVPPGSIITAVTIDPKGEGVVARTGRTPTDVPIVAAVARTLPEDPSGRNPGTSMALTGMADTPVLVDPGKPTAGLAPKGDFRGSAAYRLKLAAVLSTRAIKALL